MQMIRLAAAAALLAGTAAPAFAQGSASCPIANRTQIRISELIKGGTAEGFGEAVAAHKKWYADHGYTGDSFSWGRVAAWDPAQKKVVTSPNRLLTIHLHSSDVPDAKHDAGWDAFVAKYKANSRIVSTTLSCVNN